MNYRWLRKMNYYDIDAIMRITRTDKKAWLRLDFYDTVQSDTHCLIAEEQGRVVGFAVISFRERGTIRILNLSVEPDLRRKGIGSQIVDQIKAHRLFKNGDRTKIIFDVDKRNLAVQLFLRANSFYATMIWTGPKEEDFDLYTMEYPEEQETGNAQGSGQNQQVKR